MERLEWLVSCSGVGRSIRSRGAGRWISAGGPRVGCSRRWGLSVALYPSQFHPRFPFTVEVSLRTHFAFREVMCWPSWSLGFQLESARKKLLQAGCEVVVVYLAEAWAGTMNSYQRIGCVDTKLGWGCRIRGSTFFSGVAQPSSLLRGLPASSGFLL